MEFPGDDVFFSGGRRRNCHIRRGRKILKTRRAPTVGDDPADDTALKLRQVHLPVRLRQRSVAGSGRVCRALSRWSRDSVRRRIRRRRRIVCGGICLVAADEEKGRNRENYQRCECSLPHSYMQILQTDLHVLNEPFNRVFHQIVVADWLQPTTGSAIRTSSKMGTNAKLNHFDSQNHEMMPRTEPARTCQHRVNLRAFVVAIADDKSTFLHVPPVLS